MVDNIIELKEKLKSRFHGERYVSSGESSEEDHNISEKYVSTGESEFSRDASHPLDEVLSERHYILSGIQSFFRDRFRHEKRDFTGVAPKGYQRSDVRILEEVNEMLMRSRSIDPSDIDVSIDRGVISLNGIVHSRKMKIEAENVCGKIYGVKRIENELLIRPHGRPLIDNHTGMN